MATLECLGMRVRSRACSVHFHHQFALLAAPRCSWLLLAVPGCSWLRLAALDCYWLLLTAPGCCWLLLAAPGCSWLLLAAPGCSWLLLVAPGSSWPFLAAPCCSWLQQSGSGLRLLRPHGLRFMLFSNCLKNASIVTWPSQRVYLGLERLNNGNKASGSGIIKCKKTYHKYASANCKHTFDIS
jgi:hypothetical protein